MNDGRRLISSTLGTGFFCKNLFPRNVKNSPKFNSIYLYLSCAICLTQNHLPTYDCLKVRLSVSLILVTKKSGASSEPTYQGLSGNYATRVAFVMAPLLSRICTGVGITSLGKRHQLVLVLIYLASGANRQRARFKLLGTQTWGVRLKGADESTELRWHPCFTFIKTGQKWSLPQWMDDH